MEAPCMYILKCSDDSYYTGSTVDLERRLSEHEAGKGANYTKNKLPVQLVFFERFTNIGEAFRREKQVQGWNRNKKEALINGNFTELVRLSKSTDFGKGKE